MTVVLHKHVRVSFFLQKYKYSQHIFLVRFYVYATQQSFRQGVSLNLKTCKSINLQIIHIYMAKF